jgi:hypothetical protein
MRLSLGIPGQGGVAGGDQIEQLRAAVNFPTDFPPSHAIGGQDKSR